MAKGFDAQAEASLRLLRPATHNVVAELAELKADALAAKAQPSASTTMVSLLADKSLRLPLLIAAVMTIGQQWSGINAVFFYSTSFFAAAGLANPVLGSLLASAVNLAAIIVATPLMEVFGRKRLLLSGVGGMLFSALALTVVLMLKAVGASFVALLDTASILCVLLFVTAFEIGPGPIPWQIGGEIFPEGPRAAAMAAAASLNWLCNAAIGLSFPAMSQRLGVFSFLPFCGVLTFWLRFTSRYVPETKGKSLAQIQLEFAAISDARQ